MQQSSGYNHHSSLFSIYIRSIFLRYLPRAGPGHPANTTVERKNAVCAHTTFVKMYSLEVCRIQSGAEKGCRQDHMRSAVETAASWWWGWFEPCSGPLNVQCPQNGRGSRAGVLVWRFLGGSTPWFQYNGHFSFFFQFVFKLNVSFFDVCKNRFSPFATTKIVLFYGAFDRRVHAALSQDGVARPRASPEKRVETAEVPNKCLIHA